MLNVDLSEVDISQTINVAFSGGADSMALLHYLSENHKDLKLRAIHVNHGLGVHNDLWEIDCKNFCDDIGVEFMSDKISKRPTGNLEAGLRNARYSIFSAHCGQILTAHHADDQFETFFLKLFRGASTRGLCGLRTKNDMFDASMNVIRPMLGTTKKDIEAYCLEHHLPYIEDPSNADTTFDRNWIRHVLKHTIMDRITRFNLTTTITALNNDRKCLNELAELDMALINDEKGARKRLRTLSIHRIINLLVYCIEQRNGYNYSQKGLQEFARIIREGRVDSRGELKFGGGFFAFKGNNFWIDGVGNLHAVQEDEE